MLIEISSCRNFLDIKQTIQLFKLIQKSECTIADIKSYFRNDSVIISNLSDTLLLYTNLGILKEQNNFIELTEKNYSIDYEYLIANLLNRIVRNKIISFSNIDEDYLVDIEYNSYALRNLLMSEGFISHYHLTNLYLVNENYKKFFDNFVKNKISKEQLLKNLERQNEYGEKAEFLVINYEKERLNGKSPIIHIALEDSGAGYDIRSYATEESEEHDRYIEVKCFSSETNRFFITKNEVETSRRLRGNYYLYLVKATFNEAPIIIPNPYDSIFNNTGVEKVIESYQINIFEVEKYRE